MAGINRTGSAMDFCDESYDDPLDVIEKRKRDLEKKQSTKSRILFLAFFIALSLNILRLKICLRL